MATFIKIIWVAVAALILAAGCEESDNTQSKTNARQISGERQDRNLLTPDQYNAEQARKKGYTVTHEDTDTPAEDERCGIGGSRYSSNQKSMCDTFSETNDWYGATQAKDTECPAGFVRVDQAGIGRVGMAGSTRQCRSQSKIKTHTQIGHFYCPHGPNLLGYRTGAAASKYGVCRMKCDPDVRHQYLTECSTPAPSQNLPKEKEISIATTTTTTYIPDIYIPPPAPVISPNPEEDEMPTAAELTPAFNSILLGSAPDNTGYHVVGIDTWFWVPKIQWAPQQKVVTRADKTYTGTATPTNLSIQIAGPTHASRAGSQIVECGNHPGQVWQNPSDTTTCKYIWKNAGLYLVKAIINWSLSWVCEPACGSGSFAPLTTYSPQVNYNVTEIQALIRDIPE